MKTLTSCLVLLSVLLFATSGSAEVVQWQHCSSPNPNAPADCTIHEVRVKPCRQATEQKPCVIRGGRNASISFDYTPNFSGDLKNTASWASGLGDLKFPGMADTSACGSTACPAVSGTRQSYSYTLEIQRGYSPREYPIKWQLSNTEGKECCFIFDIKIKK